MAKRPPATTFTEYASNAGNPLSIDRTAGVIKGVRVLGLESKNGRSYSADGVRAAVGLYEGAKVNIDHPDGSASSPRSYRDRFGSLRGVQYREGFGLVADLCFNPKHPAAEQLLWDAEHAPENVGLSHNVEGRTSSKGGRVVVESITRVQSVDLVADPATTNGLFEGRNIEKDQDMDLKELSLEQLKAARADLVEAVITEHAEGKAAKAQAAELAALKEQVAKLEAEKAIAAKKTAIEARNEKLLAEAKLPESLLSSGFKKQLALTEDEAVAKELIAERKNLESLLARNAGERKPVAKAAAGDSTVTECRDAKEFASLITG